MLQVSIATALAFPIGLLYGPLNGDCALLLQGQVPVLSRA